MIHIGTYILTIQNILFTQNINQTYEMMENILYFKQTHFDNEGMSLKPNII